MQKEPPSELLVSIITICLNSEKYLDETIQSVVGQDYPNIEYIVVDGGSTDGTLGIIQKYQDRISRFVSEPDEGISDAMNKGITMASGDIIGIIHSDDYYADHTVISRVVSVFNQSDDIKAVYGTQDFIDPETKEILLTWGREAHPSEIKKRMFMPHPTIFCRREVYDTIGLFREDYRIAMDYEWAMRLTKYTTPRFLNYRLAAQRDLGLSGTQFHGGFKETVKALWEHKYYLSAIETILRNAVKRILLVMGLKRLLYKLWEKNVSPR